MLIKNKMKKHRPLKNTNTGYAPKSFREVVPQLPEESQRNYKTLRLYCQEDSLVKLSNKLTNLLQEGKCPKKVLNKKGKFPSERTLDRWCKKFDWVQRKDKWVAEECRRSAFWFDKQKHKISSFLMAVKQRQMGADEGSFQGSASVKNVTVKRQQMATNVNSLRDGKMAVKVRQSKTKGDSFGVNRGKPGQFREGKAETDHQNSHDFIHKKEKRR